MADARGPEHDTTTVERVAAAIALSMENRVFDLAPADAAWKERFRVAARAALATTAAPGRVRSDEPPMFDLTPGGMLWLDVIGGVCSHRRRRPTVADARGPEHDTTTQRSPAEIAADLRQTYARVFHGDGAGGWRIEIPQALVEEAAAALASTAAPVENPYRPHIPADLETDPPAAIWDEGYAAGLAAGRATADTDPPPTQCEECGAEIALDGEGRWAATRWAGPRHFTCGPFVAHRPGDEDRS